MPLHTDRPKFAGERALVDQLVSLGDPQLHIWCGLDFIPGVRDIDLLLWHETAGVFVVEVKAVPLAMLTSFGYRDCRIEGRPLDHGPQYQADAAATSLRNYLAKRAKPLRFIVATACWPGITREAWNRRWDDARVVGDYAEGMLFQEDFFSGAAALAKRLEYIWRHPPVRVGSTYPFQHDSAQLGSLTKELQFESRPLPIPSDRQRLELIERNVQRQADEHAPPSRDVQILYSGHPGTGKTFRLLHIGLQHALAGRRVLFACFNKVLASDIRRLMGYSERLRVAPGELVVTDLYELLSSYAAQEGIQISTSDYGEWAAGVTSAMLAGSGKGTFDTVLIDEGQDMKDWAFEMLDWQLRVGGTMCVAVGRGQELYGESSEWLKSFENRGTRRNLNRNFRNTKPVFQVSQVAYECGLQPTRLRSALSRIGAPARTDEELAFDRAEGQWPQFHSFDDTIDAGEQDPFFAHLQQEKMVGEYEKIIRGQLDDLRTGEWPQDLLVLVPGNSYLQREWAVQAVQRLGGAVTYLDYTVDSERRVIARPTDVRVCTFHSARGIEGTRVIVFGIEHLPNLARRDQLDAANLAYIALSRSIAECVIVVPKSQVGNPIVTLLQAIVAGLTSAPTVAHVEPIRTKSSAKRTSPNFNQHQAASSLLRLYAPGKTVSSNTFGVGVIVSTTVTASGTKVEVDFATGRKKLQIPPAVLDVQ